MASAKSEVATARSVERTNESAGQFAFQDEEKKEARLTKSLFRHEFDGLDEDLELGFQRVEDELLLVEPLRKRRCMKEDRQV